MLPKQMVLRYILPSSLRATCCELALHCALMRSLPSGICCLQKGRIAFAVHQIDKCADPSVGMCL